MTACPEKGNLVFPKEVKLAPGGLAPGRGRWVKGEWLGTGESD